MHDTLIIEERCRYQLSGKEGIGMLPLKRTPFRFRDETMGLTFVSSHCFIQKFVPFVVTSMPELLRSPSNVNFVEMSDNECHV